VNHDGHSLLKKRIELNESCSRRALCRSKARGFRADRNCQSVAKFGIG
jgi:hypothetical protein